MSICLLFILSETETEPEKCTFLIFTHKRTVCFKNKKQGYLYKGNPNLLREYTDLSNIVVQNLIENFEVIYNNIQQKYALLI